MTSGNNNSDKKTGPPDGPRVGRDEDDGPTLTPHEVALKPVFKGGRFDQARGYPAAALNELAAYARLIEAVAVRRHRQERREAGLQRAESGYAETVRMRLGSVEEGSAIAVLFSLATAVTDLQAAQDDVIDQLARPAGVDHEIQRYFKPLGRSLVDDEAIVLVGSNARGFTYDASVRKRILEETGQTDLDDIDVFGRIVASSTPEESEPWLTLRVMGRGPVKMRMSHEEIRKAYDRGASERLVHVRGTAQFLPNGQMGEVTQVDDLCVVDHDLDGAKQPLTDQFEKLMKQARISEVVLKRFRMFLEYCIAEGLDARPHVIDSEDGVEAEWHVGRSNTTATLGTNEKVYVHVTDLDMMTYREAEVSCDYAGARQLVATWKGDHDD